MSCEQKKDKICRATGAAYGLTGQAGNNVATTAWAGNKSILQKTAPAKPKPPNPFVARREKYIKHQTPAGKKRVERMLGKTKNFATVNKTYTHQEFIEEAFAQGWTGRCLEFSTDQKIRREWYIGREKVSKTSFEYWQYLYKCSTSWSVYSPQHRQTFLNDGRRFVVFGIPPYLDTQLVLDTKIGRGYLISSKEYSAAGHTTGLRDVLNQDTTAAEETLDFYGELVPYDSSFQPPTPGQNIVTLASTQGDKTTVTPVRSIQDAGFKLVSDYFRHSCGRYIHTGMEKIEIEGQDDFQFNKIPTRQYLYRPRYLCAHCNQMAWPS